MITHGNITSNTSSVIKILEVSHTFTMFFFFFCQMKTSFFSIVLLLHFLDTSILLLRDTNNQQTVRVGNGESGDLGGILSINLS